MYFDGGTEVASLTIKTCGAESHMSVKIFDNLEKFGESDNVRVSQNDTTLEMLRYPGRFWC